MAKELTRAEKRARDRHKRKRGSLYGLLFVVALITIMLVQLLKLHEKNLAYAAEEKALLEEKEELLEARDEIRSYSDYTKTEEYIEDMARSRYGMVKDNEIIFRESGD